ncbi:MAG: hypothetical protein E6I94_01270 [Chloroflexi bacterium]|nr:MAG: hypothetical protein E6I94_01270 [Chloroflexota bacterium]
MARNDRVLLIAIVAAALLVFVATLARQTGVPKTSTIWAEDGSVFLQCAYDRSFLDCLVTPYQGYLQLLPRLGGAIASLAPPAQSPLALGWLAALSAAAAAAAITRAVASATGSVLAGIVGSTGLGLVWQAGREVLGNLANAHWILLTAAVVVLVCGWIGRRMDRADAALVAFAGLSSGLAPLLAVVALPNVVLRRPGARTILLVAVGAALIQGVTAIATPREAPGSTPRGLADVASAFDALVVRQGFFGDLRTPPGWAVFGAIALLAVIAAAASGRQWRKAAPGLAVVAALVGIGVLVFGASIVLNRTVNPRYAYVPAALAVAALAVAAGVASRRLATGGEPVKSRRIAAAALVPALAVFLAIGFARSFRLEARASSGPDVSQELATAETACTPGSSSVTITISPHPATNLWEVRVPCERLAR